MKKRGLLRNQAVKNILSVLAVPVFGMILLNLTFMLDYLFQSVIDFGIRLFTRVDVNMAWGWFPPVKHALFVILICLISWRVFRSKLGVLLKAIYMTVPLAVVFVTIGMCLYRWPVIVYLVGGLFGIGILYYFYRSKKHWLYYYTLILVALTLMIISLLGGEI